MSGNLGPQRIRDTYGRVLQIANANEGADGVLRPVLDGKGDATPLQLSTTAVKVDGPLDITGPATALTPDLGTNTTQVQTGAGVLAEIAVAAAYQQNTVTPLGAPAVVTRNYTQDGPLAFRAERWGLVGNGTTEEYERLQRAVNDAAAAGGRLLLSAGKSYVIGRRLDLPNDCTIEWESGARIIANGSDFNSTTGGIATNNIIIYAAEKSRPKLVNAKIEFSGMPQNSDVNGIVIRGCTDVKVLGAEIFGANQSTLVQIDSSTGVVVRDCYLHDCTLDRTSTGQITGIAIDDDLLGGYPTSSDVIITDNRIARLNVTPAFLAAFDDQTDAITFAQAPGANGALVTNNRIRDVGEGIDCMADGAVISNNAFLDCRVFGVKVIHGASRVIVSGNQIDGAGKVGVIVESSTIRANMDDILVTNNLITNMNRAGRYTTGADIFGILINQPPTATYAVRRITLSGNRFAVMSQAEAQIRISTPTSGDHRIGHNFFAADAPQYAAGALPLSTEQPIDLTGSKRFGGLISAARHMTWTNDGRWTQAMGDNAQVTVGRTENNGVIAPNQGVSHAVFLSSALRDSYRAEVISTDTFATAGTSSAKYVQKVIDAGVSRRVLELHPQRGVAIAMRSSFTVANTNDLGFEAAGSGQVKVRWHDGTAERVVTLTPDGSILFPGPFADETAAKAAGVLLGSTYRVTGGGLAWVTT